MWGAWSKDTCMSEPCWVMLRFRGFQTRGRKDPSEHPDFTWDWTKTATLCSVTLSCPTPCNQRACSPLASSVHGIIPPRIVEWAAISSSRGSSQLKDRTHFSALAGRFFTSVPPGNPKNSYTYRVYKPGCPAAVAGHTLLRKIHVFSFRTVWHLPYLTIQYNTNIRYIAGKNVKHSNRIDSTMLFSIAQLYLVKIWIVQYKDINAVHFMPHKWKQHEVTYILKTCQVIT